MAYPDLSHRFQGESVARALEVVGERWTLLILREAFFGVRRFGQLARNLQIPRPTLSARLRTLVENGLLEKVPYARDPDRHEYRLTDSGRDLFAAIVVLMQWGDQHLPQPQRTANRVASPAVRSYRGPGSGVCALSQEDHRTQRHPGAGTRLPH